MLKSLEKGIHFWYADRNLKTPVECELVELEFGHPKKILAKNLTTGEIFECCPDFGCYGLRSYSHAWKDAQREEERIIR